MPNREKLIEKRKMRLFRKAPKWLQHAAVYIFVAGVLACVVYFGSDGLEIFNVKGEERRQLRSSLCSRNEDDDTGCPSAVHPGLVFPMLLGSLYLFVAIATVCDEFFVPALEEIAVSWDISDDIAGATLMAAGGSAPELATSLIGTFQGSDVGFGTIVGSAVFNVLFVISCCVIFTPKEISPLKLTAWPLARDCTYYCITLVMVAVVFGINSPGIIEGWEAAFLFSLYFGYCILMAYNEDLQKKFTGPRIATDEPSENEDETKMRRGSLYFPSRYRAGFFSLITQGGSVFDTAGVSIVFKIKGDVRSVFDQFDKDNSGTLEKHELKALLEMLGDHNPNSPVTDEVVADVLAELDLDKNGVIDFSEFTTWYVKSEQRLRNEEKKLFDEMDLNHTGHIPISHLGHLLNRLQAHYTPDQLEEAIKQFTDSESSKGIISWDRFSEWFEHTGFWKEKQHEAEIAAASAEGMWGDLLDFPKESFNSNLIYIIMAPITWSLALTCGIRDVRIPGNERWAYYQFLTSVFWIGAYAYLLVDWITGIGATLGIPAVVMGLTVLAAGTSVPDLLSSIVVAKAGKGDMAVSSSIGSNIFDVTVGLPVPWILFNLIMDCPVIVQSDNLFTSVFVLLGMVACVVLSIMAAGWKLSYQLGGVMMFLYVLFVAQDVIQVYVRGGDKC